MQPGTGPRSKRVPADVVDVQARGGFYITNWPEVPAEGVPFPLGNHVLVEVAGALRAMWSAASVLHWTRVGAPAQ